MPQRTNDFQRLIAMIYRELANSDKRVTESKMIKDVVTGTEREIDVAIEAVVAGCPILISIECRGRGRTDSVEWIDQLIGKYKNLPVDKIVAVSKSGFTGAAQRHAEANRIDLLTLKAAKSANWLWLAEMTKPKYVTMHRSELVGVRLGLADATDMPEGFDALNVVVFRPDGTRLGSIAQLHNYLIESRPIDELLTRADLPTIQRQFHLLPGMYVIDLQGTKHPMSSVIFEFKLHHKTMEIEQEPATLGDINVAYGASSTERWSAAAVTVKQDEQPMTWGLTLTSVPGAVEAGTILRVYSEEITEDGRQVSRLLQ